MLDVDRFLAGKPLAITDAGLEELREHILAQRAALYSQPREFMAEAIAAIQSRMDRRPTGHAVGVIPIRGTISQHSASDLMSLLFGGTSTEQVSATLREYVADDSIGKIVLDIDSPGGSVFGIQELAQEIYKARSAKPIVAIANATAASAAYWLGSAASEFYITPSGQVGSIGVVAIHQDVSKAADQMGIKTTLISAGKFKTLGNQFEPLTDDARTRIQADIDERYGAFVHDVARFRGVTEARVRNGFGEGDVVGAKAAKAEGMVDGIATLDQVIIRPARLPQQVDPEPVTAPIDTAEAFERIARMRLASFMAAAAAGG